MSRTLTLEQITNDDTLDSAEQVRIDVPEFGEGATVNVHPLTVVDKGILGAWAANGNHSSLAIIGALASRDDDGRLVFGLTRGDAIQRVESMPEKYYPAIARIARAAMHLTAGKLVDEEGTPIVDDNEAIEAAQKN